MAFLIRRAATCSGRMSPGGHLLLILTLAWTVMGLGKTAHPAEPEFKEYQVKAAFLYNLANFVQWPDSAFNGADSPFVIGIVGSNPFGTMLEKLAQGEEASGRRLEIRQLRSLEEGLFCQIVFIAKDKAPTFDAAVLGARPVLTVADSDGFAQARGMVTLLYVENKVRLLVHLEAARSAGLKISSKLLNVAAIHQP